MFCSILISRIQIVVSIMTSFRISSSRFSLSSDLDFDSFVVKFCWLRSAHSDLLKETIHVLVSSKNFSASWTPTRQSWWDSNAAPRYRVSVFRTHSCFPYFQSLKDILHSTHVLFQYVNLQSRHWFSLLSLFYISVPSATTYSTANSEENYKSSLHWLSGWIIISGTTESSLTRRLVSASWGQSSAVRATSSPSVIPSSSSKCFLPSSVSTDTH